MGLQRYTFSCSSLLIHPSVEGEAFTKFLYHDLRSFIAARSSGPERPVSFSRSILMVTWSLLTRRLVSGDQRSSFPAGFPWRETCQLAPSNSVSQWMIFFGVSRTEFCLVHDLAIVCGRPCAAFLCKIHQVF